MHSAMGVVVEAKNRLIRPATSSPDPLSCQALEESLPIATSLCVRYVCNAVSQTSRSGDFGEHTLSVEGGGNSLNPNEKWK